MKPTPVVVPDALVMWHHEGQFTLNTERCPGCRTAVVWKDNLPLTASTVESRKGVLYALPHEPECSEPAKLRRALRNVE